MDKQKFASQLLKLAREIIGKPLIAYRPSMLTKSILKKMEKAGATMTDDGKVIFVENPDKEWDVFQIKRIIESMKKSNKQNISDYEKLNKLIDVFDGMLEKDRSFSNIDAVSDWVADNFLVKPYYARAYRAAIKVEMMKIMNYIEDAVDRGAMIETKKGLDKLQIFVAENIEKWEKFAPVLTAREQLNKEMIKLFSKQTKEDIDERGESDPSMWDRKEVRFKKIDGVGPDGNLRRLESKIKNYIGGEKIGVTFDYLKSNGQERPVFMKPVLFKKFVKGIAVFGIDFKDGKEKMFYLHNIL